MGDSFEGWRVSPWVRAHSHPAPSAFRLLERKASQPAPSPGPRPLSGRVSNEAGMDMGGTGNGCGRRSQEVEMDCSGGGGGGRGDGGEGGPSFSHSDHSLLAFPRLAESDH